MSTTITKAYIHLPRHKPTIAETAICQGSLLTSSGSNPFFNKMNLEGKVLYEMKKMAPVNKILEMKS